MHSPRFNGNVLTEEGFASIAKTYCLAMACVKNVWAIVSNGYLKFAFLPKRGEPQDNAVATIAWKADFVEAFVGNVKQKKPSLSENGKKLD